MEIYYSSEKNSAVCWIDEDKNYISTSINNPVVVDYLKSGKTILPFDAENPLVLQWENMMENS